MSTSLVNVFVQADTLTWRGVRSPMAATVLWVNSLRCICHPRPGALCDGADAVDLDTCMGSRACICDAIRGLEIDIPPICRNLAVSH